VIEPSTFVLNTDDEANDEHDFRRFQEITRDTFEFVKLSRRICLIKRNDASEATGFLVGPDLMLTAAHALLGTRGIFADPDEVTILFDQFIWNQKTGRVAHGDECRLRRIPFTDQPDVVASSIKIDAKSRKKLDDNELDYVLVRLDRPIGLMFLPYSHRIRGWNNLSAAKAPAAGHVQVVQHPEGGLMKFSDGWIWKTRRHSRRFHYRTAALDGASGAPIYNEKKQVVGMHVGENSPSDQLGVSFQHIFRDLRKKHVRLPRFSLPPKLMDTLFGTSEVEWQRKDGTDWRGDRLFGPPRSRRRRPRSA